MSSGATPARSKARPAVPLTTWSSRPRLPAPTTDESSRTDRGIAAARAAPVRTAAAAPSPTGAAGRRIGDEGQGLPLALAALDSGRLGIAAVATGVALAALDVAVRYASEREAFGKAIIGHQGLAFLLADMAAAVESARATYLHAARLRDAGRPFSRAAAIAKLVATDNAMRVTTDAVQVLGGAGYTRDFPVERYMREVKVMQIFEGTNQIQRLVISRALAQGSQS
jgi:alkylation response protein AidB-like acyl-CoA dehydrogenase